MNVRNTLLQVCDLEVGAVGGGENHRSLGCCKCHQTHKGPNLVSGLNKSFFFLNIYVLFFRLSINASVINEAHLPQSNNKCVVA